MTNEEKVASGQELQIVQRVFWAVLAAFVLVLSEFFVPAVNEFFQGSILFLAPFALFSLLGLVLVIVTIKQKVQGRLRLFLLMTGGASLFFFIGVVLHNLVYGLMIVLFGEGFWESIGMADEPIFFLLALVVSPICFIIGSIGSIVYFLRRR